MCLALALAGLAGALANGRNFRIAFVGGRRRYVPVGAGVARSTGAAARRAGSVDGDRGVLDQSMG